MKNKVLNRIICIVAMLITVALFVSLSQYYVFRVHGRDQLRIDGFRHEPKDSIDVVLLGASDIYTSFSSCLAYEEYGFTSYPYTVSAAPVSMWKTMLTDVLEHQDPKLIVIELNGCVYQTDEQLYSNAAAHYLLDSMPLCKNKIDTLNDMSKAGTLDPKSSFYFPIIKYHSDWTDLRANKNNILNVAQQYTRGYNLLKGISSASFTLVDGTELRDVSNDTSESPLYPASEEYLRDFLQYCKDEKFDNIIFVRFPHRIGTAENDPVYLNYQKTNAAARIVQEYGFEYYNFEAYCDEIGLDANHDFYNINHLNIYGQAKFTEFFANWLVTEKGITPSDLSKNLQDEWDKCAKYYREYSSYVQELTEKNTDKTIAETYGTIQQLTARLQQEGKK